MKKIIISIILVVVMVFSSTSAFAASVAPAQGLSIKQQAAALIANIDEATLMADASANVIDYSVPVEIRNSIVAEASFQPLSRGTTEQISLDVTTTVKRVGEVYAQNGDAHNLYVAAAAVTPKEDWSYEGKHGIKAWAFVYWIDHYGTENELYGAGAQWDPQGKVLTDRRVRYGTTDIFWLTWPTGSTLKCPEEDWAYYEDPGVYKGYVLRCQTQVEVVNLGIVTCNVGSRIVT